MDEMARDRTFWAYTLEELAEVVAKPWKQFAKWADSKLSFMRKDIDPSMSDYRCGLHAFPVSGDIWCDAEWRLMALRSLSLVLPEAGTNMAKFLRDELGIAPHGIPIFPEIEEFQGYNDRYGFMGRRNRIPVIQRCIDQVFDHLPEINLGIDKLIDEDEKQTEESVEKYANNPSLVEDIREDHLWFAKKFRLAQRALQGQQGTDEFFWTLIQEETAVAAESLTALKKDIEACRPTSNFEMDNLNQHLGYVRMCIDTEELENGTVTCRMLARPRGPRYNEDPIEYGAKVLVAPLAHEMAGHLVRSQAWPRYVASCRNPECGREFYAGRQDAKACPKRPHEKTTSPCKRAWDNYRRWLENNGHDPDACWDNDELKQQYLAEHKPRGSQSGILGG